MHPEVRQLGPGSCPKCGMALDPLVPDLEVSEENSEYLDFRRRFWGSLPLSVVVTVLALAGHYVESLSPATRGTAHGGVKHFELFHDSLFTRFGLHTSPWMH